MPGRILSSITAEDLKMIAREATSDHLQNSTPLTDAVVKAASLFDRPLTDEHVRRICEMSYHDTFERMFKGASGPDRYISFDPADAVEAAARLRAERVSSTRMKTASVPTFAPIMEKAAFAPTSRRKFQPRNFLDDAKEASADNVVWFDPLSEIRHVRSELSEAVTALENELSGLDGAEKMGMLDLVSQAYQAWKDGSSIPTVLHACLSHTGSEKIASGAAAEILDELTLQLGKIGLPLEAEKVASARVNPNHPLPQVFNKVAGFRHRRLHVEYALEELKADLGRVNEEIRGLCI